MDCNINKLSLASRRSSLCLDFSLPTNSLRRSCSFLKFANKDCENNKDDNKIQLYCSPRKKKSKAKTPLMKYKRRLVDDGSKSNLLTEEQLDFLLISQGIKKVIY